MAVSGRSLGLCVCVSIYLSLSKRKGACPSCVFFLFFLLLLPPQAHHTDTGGGGRVQHRCLFNKSHTHTHIKYRSYSQGHDFITVGVEGVVVSEWVSEWVFEWQTEQDEGPLPFVGLPAAQGFPNEDKGSVSRRSSVSIHPQQRLSKTETRALWCRGPSEDQVLITSVLPSDDHSPRKHGSSLVDWDPLEKKNYIYIYSLQGWRIGF